ncbi:MAG: RHS repeat-associated core domain-containing protein, partial [Terriglobia bacterium]
PGNPDHGDFADMQEGGASGGIDMTPNREYGSLVGRWLSPDPTGGDLTNPQSLNRYAYTLNNPMSLVDPTGLGPLRYAVANQSFGDEFDYIFNYDNEGALWFGTDSISWGGSPGTYSGPGGGGGTSPPKPAPSPCVWTARV